MCVLRDLPVVCGGAGGQRPLGLHLRGRVPGRSHEVQGWGEEDRPHADDGQDSPSMSSHGNLFF